MCLGNVVEGEHAVAKFRQKVSAEGDNSPERKLGGRIRAVHLERNLLNTYDGHYIILDLSGQRNEAEESAQVELYRKLAGAFYVIVVLVASIL